MNCIGCGARMSTRLTRGATIDVCDRCGGLWFDPGELERYIRENRIGKPTKHLKETDLKIHHGGDDRICPRCEAMSLQVGVLRGIPFRSCRLCNGVFITQDSLLRAAAKTGEPLNVSSYDDLWKELPDFLWHALFGSVGLIVYATKKYNERFKERAT